MSDIPTDAAELDLEGKIPQDAVEITQEIESPEVIPYVISFEKYNEKLCEIRELDSNKGRKAVEIFKKIGTQISSRADFQRYSIDQIPVRCAGEYKKLFGGLAEDIELKEIKLQQDARIFYFDIESKKVFYVVAITRNHLETDKVRK